MLAVTVNIMQNNQVQCACGSMMKPNDDGSPKYTKGDDHKSKSKKISRFKLSKKIFFPNGSWQVDSTSQKTKKKFFCFWLVGSNAHFARTILTLEKYFISILCTQAGSIHFLLQKHIETEYRVKCFYCKDYLTNFCFPFRNIHINNVDDSINVDIDNI